MIFSVVFLYYLHILALSNINPPHFLIKKHKKEAYLEALLTYYIKNDSNTHPKQKQKNTYFSK